MREGFPIKKLGEICEVIAGQSPEGKYYNREGNGLPFYQGKKEFKSKFLGLPTTWTIKVTKEAKQGDILMSVRAPVGPVNFAIQDICIGRGLAAIRASEMVDEEYLFYFLKKHETEIESNAGAVFNSINKTQISNIEVPTPSISAQKEVVVILDQLFSAIDQAKANIEKNIGNVKELFQSKLNEIFSQESEDWKWKKLGKVCENLDSKRIPITKNKRTEGAIPYYGASGVVDYVADYIFDEDLLLVSEDGANLLARTYPIAFSISGKTWVNNHAHVLRFEEKISQIFIQYYLNSIKLDDFISGMAQPKLNQKKLNSIPVPFPEVDIQIDIVRLIQSLDNCKFKITVAYQKKLEVLEELKMSILQKAFKGELTKKELVH